MKCIIPGTNAKILARAIQCLSRIGNELFLEASDIGLSLRTVNSAKSVFAMMHFSIPFFTEFIINTDTDDEFDNKCKISMKSSLGVFKNMKQVELCKISLNINTGKLVFKLKCQLETIKTHYVSILEQESLQAAFLKDNVPNVMEASYKVFSEIVSNFQLTEEELTLEANSDTVIAKNYFDGGHIDKRIMRSKLTLRHDEFDIYSITEETAITFCLKELRAFLNLAEALNLNIAVNFERAGKPVVFILKNLETFEATLVMSTLSAESVDNCNQSVTNPVKETSKMNSKRNISHDSLIDNNKNKMKKPRDNEPKNKILQTQNSSFFQFDVVESYPSADPPQRKQTNNNNDDNVSLSQQVIGIMNKAPYTSKTSTRIVTNPINLMENQLETQMDMDIDFNFDTVPKSPHTDDSRQKTRVIFRRCFEATLNPNAIPGSSQVLAENSDNEDIIEIS